MYIHKQNKTNENKTEQNKYSICDLHVGGMVDAYGPDAHMDTLGMLSILTESPSDTTSKCLITDAVPADHMGFTFHLDPTG